MKRTTAIILSLVLALFDLILEKPEGLNLIGISLEGITNDGLNKLIYYSGSIIFHLVSCTLIIWLTFNNKPYYKSFFWLLFILLFITTPLFYYFNIYLNEKGEDRILAISSVYYFLRSPIILIYALPIYFIWAKKNKF